VGDLQDSNRAPRATCGSPAARPVSPTQSCGALAPPNAVINMSAAAIATFVVIGGIVWGGFLLIVTTAVRKESRKADQG